LNTENSIISNKIFFPINLLDANIGSIKIMITLCLIFTFTASILYNNKIMYHSKITGLGYYVPDNVVTNDDLSKIMDTNDEWIQERTGIQERRHIVPGEDTTTTMGVKAARIAIERSGIAAADIDFVVFATLSPDYYFPGPGVLVQRDLGLRTVGALDVRNQCSGFVYGISVADQYIKTGMYKNILVIGSEVQSTGLDMTDRGRSVSVIFGDGAGAAVLSREEDVTKGILSTHLHSEGQHAEELIVKAPGMGGRWVTDILAENNPNDESYFPYMNGQFVFKNAVVRFAEVINEGLEANNLGVSDIDMLIPHQANLRISQFIQKKFKLDDDKVFNNIQKYGNTTAASIPIALTEAWEQGKIKSGDVVILAAFGSGFTWGSVIIKW
jgi:3-oxoacyl-[acyl-carrier-protein] synthase-3